MSLENHKLRQVITEIQQKVNTVDLNLDLNEVPDVPDEDFYSGG